MGGDIQYGAYHEQNTIHIPQRPVDQTKRPPVKHDRPQIEGYIRQENRPANRAAPLDFLYILNYVAKECPCDVEESPSQKDTSIPLASKKTLTKTAGMLIA